MYGLTRWDLQASSKERLLVNRCRTRESRRPVSKHRAVQLTRSYLSRIIASTFCFHFLTRIAYFIGHCESQAQLCPIYWAPFGHYTRHFR